MLQFIIRIVETNLPGQESTTIATMGPKTEDNAILNEYNSIFSRRVDLVSDYAGSETFLIEFDSLLLFCFSNPKLDFNSKLEAICPLEFTPRTNQPPRWLSATSRSLHC